MNDEKAILYKAGRLDDLLVFKADYHKFQFRRHAHEDFALGLMECGRQKFSCRGEEFCAQPGSLITVNAGDIHDGMSADGMSYHYRIIYLPVSLLKSVDVEMVSGGGTNYFQRSVTEDRELARQLHYILCLLERKDHDAVEVQSLFYSMLAELLRKYGISKAAFFKTVSKTPRSIERACEYINDMALEAISLDDIATAAGLSRYHFLRVFSASQGVTPHSYLVYRRLQLARQAIKDGTSLADAALETRFADQSHFARKFKSVFGITPGQYKKAVC